VPRVLPLIILLSFGALSAHASGVEEVQDKSALILDFDQGEDVKAGAVRLVNEVVAAAFGAHQNLAVMTNKDLERVVGLEAQKQAAGCEDDTSCLAELGEAMGADYVVSGGVTVLGSSTFVDLAVREGLTIVDRFRVESKDAAQLPALLDARIAEALKSLFPAEERAPAPEPEPPPPPSLSALQWAGVGVAAGGALMALGSGIVVGVIEGELANETPSAPGDRLGTQGLGQIMVVGLVLGIAAAAGGVGMVMYGGEG
jgi:hypothetical protein